MGLDQFAFTRQPYAGRDSNEELHYWRKHNRLHGWMEKLYHERGGVKEFNCQEVPITLEDLDELEEAIQNHELPETHGFFFGDDSYDYYKQSELFESDMEFIEKARKAINGGLEVYYDSWW